MIKDTTAELIARARGWKRTRLGQPLKSPYNGPSTLYKICQELANALDIAVIQGREAQEGAYEAAAALEAMQADLGTLQRQSDEAAATYLQEIEHFIERAEKAEAENERLRGQLRCRPPFDLLPSAFKDTAP